MPDLHNANIARFLSMMAASDPQAAAIKIPRGRLADKQIDYLSLSFAELDEEVSAWSYHLLNCGVKRSDRTLVMVKPGLPLIACVFALFRIGSIPVVIDPGMGIKNFLNCVSHTQPRALVGIPIAQILSRLFIPSFKSVKVRINVSGSLTAQLRTKIYKRASAENAPANNASSDLAAILFTSGSTGAPKGVSYEHGMFDAQVKLLKNTYGFRPGEVDLPLLPIFALFDPALGMTAVIPELNPSKPAKADPAKLVQAILQQKVTSSFGSPTLWGLISEYCKKEKITLPTLKRVLCAGAPVPSSLWEDSVSFIPNGLMHSPYGATESLPVSSINRIEKSTLLGVRGACVGKPIEGMQVKIIPIEDGAIEELGATQSLATNQIGEIIVSGPVVTKEYDRKPEATRMSKIKDAGNIWHRMGDCGFIDPEGNLWFCGRKVERVTSIQGPYFTEPCERVFKLHPRVTRCALIGLGEAQKQTPALVVELEVSDKAEALILAKELKALATTYIPDVPISKFYFKNHFPVDVRHNAKIHRLTLARWAKEQIGFSV
ncbi:MAG: fatty acid CoA ligase family protein [Verrucomicrobiota bacterium]|jgi:acyl-CoA synthetase (AMP-forming)/AMP-acid ligase II